MSQKKLAVSLRCKGEVRRNELMELSTEMADENEEYQSIVPSQPASINYEDALKLNQQMQERLLKMRVELLRIKKSIGERYRANEQVLCRNMRRTYRNQIGARSAYLKGGSFYFKGNMFFRDSKLRNCPYNTDYESRLLTGEIFPMDFNLCSRHIWSLVDKAGIVNAIKEQIIQYQQSDTVLRRQETRLAKQSMITTLHEMKLINMLETVDESFQIDWHQIAAHNLNYRHSPTSCEAMWFLYLHPSLCRAVWTAEENDKLLNTVKELKYQNWEAIAEKLQRRSPYQCFVHFYTQVVHLYGDRCSKWKQDDDERLLDLIKRHSFNGRVNWSAIYPHFPERSRTSLMQRYKETLNPKINRGHFTMEEDLLLIATVKQHGRRFATIPRHLFPNRSIAQLRAHYNNTLQYRHQLSTWSLADDNKLLEFVTHSGSSAWTLCAQEFGNRSRTSCRTRFLTIQKFLKKNPDATLAELPRRGLVNGYSDVTLNNWCEKIRNMRDDNQSEDDTTIKKVPRKKFRPRHENHIDINAKRTRRKAIYIERLRPVEMRMYNFFKFGYKFELGKNRSDIPSERSYNFCRLLDKDALEAPPSECFAISLTSHNNDCEETTTQQYLEHLPPSWSTAVGFRALCIQAAIGPQGNTVPSGMKAADNLITDREAIQIFRERLRVLFYKCAVLSRLKPGNL